MRTFNRWLALAIAAAAAAACSPTAPAAAAAGSPPPQIAYNRIGLGDYQNFVGNWDDKRQPVLYALIQTPAHYAALFHPAPVSFGNRAFAPEPALYGKEQILLVSRVVPSTPHPDQLFDVERLTADGPLLTLRYRFHAPDSRATSQMKDSLILRLPRHDYRKVALFENGQPIGQLDLAAGQWSVPPPPPPGPR